MEDAIPNGRAQLSVTIGRKALLPVDEAFNLPIAPTSVQLALTEACPMHCVHCDLWKTQEQHRELSTEKWKEVINDLAAWLPHQNLHFTGGEPFLRRDFMELVSHAAHKHGMLVSANTSGILIRESILDQVMAAGFHGLIFSIDGLKELHGDIRGNAAVFERNLKSMEVLRHHMFITIATVIMEQNLEQLPRLVEFAVDVGAAGIGFQPLFQNFGAPPDPTWYKTSSIWPQDPSRVEAIIEQLIDMKSQRFPILNTTHQLELYKRYFHYPVKMREYQCLVGETNLAVSPYGEVRLCYQMPPIGNVKHSLPSELWMSREAQRRREIINNCHKCCRIMNCNYNEL